MLLLMLALPTDGDGAPLNAPATTLAKCCGLNGTHPC